MKRHIFKLLLLNLICLSSSVADNATTGSPSEYRDGFIVKIGDMAPDFTLHYLDSTEEPVQLSSLRGKIVLLQFTDSGCGVCHREMPALEKQIWQVFKDEDFLLIGVDRKESPEKVRKFIEQTGVTYPMALDRDGSIFDLYAANSGITRNVLIDKEGKIVFLTRLYRMHEFNGLIDTINELLYSCGSDGDC